MAVFATSQTVNPAFLGSQEMFGLLLGAAR
jgi:hypothetical protein